MKMEKKAITAPEVSMPLNEKEMSRYREGVWLTKDNKLIRMHANMTSFTYKLTNLVLWKSIQEGRLDNIKITTAEIKNILEYKGNDLSQRLKKESEKVMKTIVGVEKKDKTGQWTMLTLIPKMEYNGSGVLTAIINPDLKTYINGLTKTFTKTDYRRINGLSYPGMRMAEICNSWVNYGYALYSVLEWRALLGATTVYYGTYSRFKEKILKPVVKEVNENMDFIIKPIEIKEGRKVSYIKMIIKRRKEKIACEKMEEKSPIVPVEEENTVYKYNLKVMNDGKAKEQVLELKEDEKAKDNKNSQQDFANLSDIEQLFVKRMVEDYELTLPVAIDAILKYGVSYCTKQMEVVRLAIKSGKKITNKGGFLRKAIEEGYAQSKEALEKAKAAEEEKIKDKRLWDKQAKEFFQSKKKSSSLDEEKSYEEIIYEKEYEIWEKKKTAFRFELIRMVKDGKIEMEMINPAVAEFEAKNPPPVKPKEKAKKEMDEASKILISQLVDNFSMSMES